MTQKPMLIRCGSNRFINLNHIMDIHFCEEKYEDYEATFWSVTLKFADGIREDFTLSVEEFQSFITGVYNALV